VVTAVCYCGWQSVSTTRRARIDDPLLLLLLLQLGAVGNVGVVSWKLWSDDPEVLTPRRLALPHVCWLL